MLTDTAIRKAAPRAKPFKLSDSRGLYVLVKPNGSKLFRYDYRVSGVRQTASIGEYPMVTLQAARDEHGRLWAMVRAGTDPGEVKRLQKLIPDDEGTFAAVYHEWAEKKSLTWSADYAKDVRRRFERDLLPDLGRMKMVDITAPVVLAVLQKIEKREVLYTVKRARENVGTLFRYAMTTGRCQHDPCQALRGAFIGHKEKHYPAITDPEPFGELLRAIWDYSGTFVVRQALRLSALFGLRPGEIRHLEWSEVDLRAEEIRLPPEKQKKTGLPHMTPLTAQTIALLEETQEVTGRGRYVLPCARNPRGDRPMSEAGCTSALHRLGYKGIHTPHGFRSSFSSLLNEAGHFSADAIERQLSHRETNKVRAAYHRASYLAERRRIMKWWADYCDELRLGRQPGRGKVVPFSRG